MLLDIKEYLATGATGNGQTFAPVPGSASTGPQYGPAVPSPMGSGGNQTVIDLRQGSGPDLGQRAMLDQMQRPPNSEGQHEHVATQQSQSPRPEEVAFAAPSSPGEPAWGPNQGSKSQAHDAGHDEQDTEGAQKPETSALPVARQGAAPVVDLLTVSVVAQWMSRAINAVGRDQIDKLIEIYDITSSLPPGLKQTMLLLSELYGGGSEADDASDERRQVPATIT